MLFYEDVDAKRAGALGFSDERWWIFAAECARGAVNQNDREMTPRALLQYLFKAHRENRRTKLVCRHRRHNYYTHTQKHMRRWLFYTSAYTYTAHAVCPTAAAMRILIFEILPLVVCGGCSCVIFSALCVLKVSLRAEFLIAQFALINERVCDVPRLHHKLKWEVWNGCWWEMIAYFCIWHRHILWEIKWKAENLTVLLYDRPIFEFCLNKYF